MWRRVDLPGESTKCLDGSSAAFFFRPPVDQPPLANQTFVFFLEGGGWCNSPIDCVSRTQSTFGSSARFPPDRTRNPGNGAGYFADNSLLGREFRSSTLIHVKYCDGASFSGEASVELHAANAQVALGPRRTIAKSQRFSIHFSGRGILRAIVNVMLADSTFGLRRAKHVLLSGCSAGGLAALLNADRLAQQILNGGVQLSRFKVVVFSGIFHAPDASPYAQQKRALLLRQHDRGRHACLPGTVVNLRSRALALYSQPRAARGVALTHTSLRRTVGHGPLADGLSSWDAPRANGVVAFSSCNRSHWPEHEAVKGAAVPRTKRAPGSAQAHSWNL